MRGLFIAAFIWLGFVGSPAIAQSGIAPNSIGSYACQRSVVYDASTNGATVLVGPSGIQTGNGGNIVICGYQLFAGGTANVALEYGTGTACGTGTTKITPAYQLTAQTGVSDTSVFFRGLSVPAGNSLCLMTSAGVAVQGSSFISNNPDRRV